MAFCSNCGQPLEERDHFCMACGAAVAALKPASTPPVAAKRNRAEKRRVSTLMLGCAVVVGLFVIWIAYLMIFDHAPDSTAVPQRQAEPAPAIEHEKVVENQAADQAKAREDNKEKRRQALALAFADTMRQQGYEVSVSAHHDQLWIDCSTALDPRSSCYDIYQLSKHMPSNFKTELRADGITTLNFSPNGELIPTWAIVVR